MIASAHIAAGFVAGMAGAYATRNRVLRLAAAFTLAFVLHFQLDAIPHSDYAGLPRSALGVVASLEVAAVCAIGMYILRRRLLLHWPEFLFAGLSGSVLPDARFLAPIVLSDRNARLVEYYGNRLHEGLHAGTTSLALGLAAELVSTILLLACLYAFPRTEYRLGRPITAGTPADAVLPNERGS